MIAGLTAGAGPSHVARAAFEGIAWRVADVLAAVRETVPVEALRVDGGLTRSDLLLQLQADTTGVAVQRGAVDATAAGAAALAAVGAGVFDSVAEIGERIPIGAPVEPRRDDGVARARARGLADASWSARQSCEPAYADAGSSPARMCSVPSMCSRIRPTARVASPRRISRTSSACWAFEWVSTCSGWAISAIRSLIAPWTSVISATSRGERAASATPM